eukprot:357647_1
MNELLYIYISFAYLSHSFAYLWYLFITFIIFAYLLCYLSYYIRSLHCTFIFICANIHLLDIYYPYGPHTHTLPIKINIQQNIILPPNTHITTKSNDKIITKIIISPYITIITTSDTPHRPPSLP